MLILALTFEPCVLTFAPYILTFAPCACGVSLLSTGATILYTCTGGGCHQLQHALVVPFPAATIAQIYSPLAHMHIYMVVHSLQLALVVLFIRQLAQILHCVVVVCVLVVIVWSGKVYNNHGSARLPSVGIKHEFSLCDRCI